MAIKKNLAESRYATKKEAISTRFMVINRRLDIISREYELPDHKELNRARFPWARCLHYPEFYASRLWEYPWAITETGLRPGMKCADVGCGQSPFTVYLKEISKCEVTGFDPDRGPTNQAKHCHGVPDSFINRTGIPVVKSGIEKIKWRNNYFDRVFCLSVIEHVDTTQSANKGMKEVARILKPGGLALISVDVNLKKRMANPLELIWESGLILRGSIDLLMPRERFGIFCDGAQPADVFGFVLEKPAGKIKRNYKDKKATLETWRACLLRDNYPPNWPEESQKAKAETTNVSRIIFNKASQLIGRIKTTFDKNETYISFVIAARNDNYGGNFLERLDNFVRSLAPLYAEFGVPIEIVVVEWNPPKNAPRLSEAIHWPNDVRCKVRIVEVPTKLHGQIPNSDKMPIFEYIAKNVGIRRAEGKYVLATNPDLIYSRQLIQWLSKKKLCPNNFYRIDRFDFNGPVPHDLSPNNIEKFCLRKSFRKMTIEGELPLSQGDRGKDLNGIISTDQSVIHTDAAGDFFLMAAKHWKKLRGYPQLNTAYYIDGYMCYIAASSGRRQEILAGSLRIYHQEHNRSSHQSRPKTNYQEYLKVCQKMVADHRPWLVNTNDWGLDKYKLKETVIT